MYNLTDLIEILYDYYEEYAAGKPMDYTFGFMDAVAVIRDIERNGKFDRTR